LGKPREIQKREVLPLGFLRGPKVRKERKNPHLTLKRPFEKKNL